MLIKLDSLIVDTKFQPRDNLDGSHLNNLKELYLDEVKLPAITVFEDNDLSYVIDGFHRYRAAQLAGLDSIECVKFQGSYDQALYYGFKSNMRHGLSLSRAERVKFLLKALETPIFKNMSVREAAKELNVSKSFIDRLKNRDNPNHWYNQPHEPKEDIIKGLKETIDKLNDRIAQLETQLQKREDAPQAIEKKIMPNHPMLLAEIIDGLSVETKSKVTNWCQENRVLSFKNFKPYVTYEISQEIKKRFL